MSPAGRLFLAASAALAALAIYLPGAWHVPLYNTPEPLEALVVWEMVETGDWVLPRRNGEEIPAKPPLFHWIASAIASARGEVDELAVRLPSVLSGAAAVGLVSGVGAARFGTLAGIASALVLGTSPEWVRWALLARTDAVFSLAVAAAFLLVERFGRDGRMGTLVGGSAVAAAATLGKGPAGILLPGAALLLWPPSRRALARLGPARLGAAASVFLLLAGSWYAAAASRGGLAFVEKQILLENVFRLLPHEGGPSREHSVGFYVPALLIGMFPWSLALPAALLAAWREPESDRRDLSRFLLLWIAVVFSVCTAASGKRSNYILPLYPAAALAIGAWIGGVVAHPTPAARRALAILGLVAAVLLGAAAVVLGAWRLGFEPWRAVLPYLHPRDRHAIPAVTAALGAPPLWLLLPTLGLAAALPLSLRRGRIGPSLGLFAAIILLATLAGTAVVRPAAARLRTFAPFAAEVASLVEPTDPVWFWKKPEYGLLFYLRRRVPVTFSGFERLPRPGWVLVWEVDWEALPLETQRQGKIRAASPPAALHRRGSRLYLVELAEPQ
jgi:4-amino-4-deoxy-L-arabinose transferase-like glycosyltransferase